MTLNRLILLSLLSLTLLACNKSQPSGIPETSSTPPTPAAAPAPAPSATPAAEAPAVADTSPPLDEQIPPYEKTGYPDCDDYIENYRQCLNTRLGPDERKFKAQDLHNSVRAILGNIGRGVDGARVAGLCKKARGLAEKKLTDLGCTI
ncbi:MAG TPA: hypothetical protein VFN25_12435 [Dokdonella sp.]|uniref:hypothetical protein n=1 Tax=Dokdonella sp. TaxID=2291710 RepID=UPI002D7F2747|nr:hypothetical protein [Dokdonella sp.]HET9033699.1 hypothetical protein [Dokdonella sp.]